MQTIKLKTHVQVSRPLKILWWQSKAGRKFIGKDQCNQMDDNKKPYDPCNIDEIATVVRIVEIKEVSAHYE